MNAYLCCPTGRCLLGRIRGCHGITVHECMSVTSASPRGPPPLLAWRYVNAFNQPTNGIVRCFNVRRIFIIFRSRHLKRLPLVAPPLHLLCRILVRFSTAPLCWYHGTNTSYDLAIFISCFYFISFTTFMVYLNMISPVFQNPTSCQSFFIFFSFSSFLSSPLGHQ